MVAGDAGVVRSRAKPILRRAYREPEDGCVRAAVVEKMKIQEIGAAFAFSAGDPVETALRTALIAAIA